MYTQYFGLTKFPFALTPDTSFFLELAPYQQALDTLLLAIEQGEGMLKITGEVGTGKTLLCHEFIRRLQKPYFVIFLPNPYLTPEELRHVLANKLKLADDERGEHQLTEAIRHRLMALDQQGYRIVLVMDESQALPTETLEALRLFGNLETQTRKLLQIVLFGQPELDQRLTRSELRQLRQRITFSATLRPLNSDEIGAYIQHRMSVAGASRAVFSPACIKKIAKASRGIPRLINVLCHKTLLVAYGRGLNQTQPKLVSLAIDDTEDASKQRLGRVLLPLSGVLLLAAGIAAGWWVGASL